MRFVSTASRALNLDRRMYVYLPPDYEREPERRHLVLYLRYGNGDTESSWNGVGRAGVILDNLLAQRKAAPMIIVMPNGYPSTIGSGSDDAGIEKIGRELLSDIVPFVDAHYRTSPTAANRAVAGLSMGAGQSFVTGLTHPDVFGSVGAFSSGLIANANYRIEDDVPGFLTDPKKTNANVRLFLSCGTEDPRYPGYVKLVGFLKQAGITVDWFSTSGDHEWKVWRTSLAQMLPKLFRPTTSGEKLVGSDSRTMLSRNEVFYLSTIELPLSSLKERPPQAFTTSSIKHRAVGAVRHSSDAPGDAWSAGDARFRSLPDIASSAMTQRYMHLSPAALDAAIRLLDGHGDILATAATTG